MISAIVLLDAFCCLAWIVLCYVVIATHNSAAGTRFLPGPPYWPSSVWGASDPGPWCERDQPDALLREPANAATDIPFFGYSLYMIRCAVVDFLNPPLDRTARFSLRSYPALELLCGLLNAIHGFGTFTNHACRCHFGHVLDVWGMFLILSFYSILQLCTLQVLRHSNDTVGISTSHVVALQAGAAIALWPASQHFYADSWCEAFELIGFIACLLPCLLGHFVIHRQHKHIQYNIRSVLKAVGCLLAGAVAQSLDQPRHGFPEFCRPDSLLQLHALWHLLTGVALILMFEVYRTVQVTDISSRKMK